MAKSIIEVLASDLSNEKSDDVQTVTFSLNNQAYSIDLTTEEDEDFELLFQDNISVARKECLAQRELLYKEQEVRSRGPNRCDSLRDS